MHRCDCGVVLNRDVAAAQIVLMGQTLSRERVFRRQASGLPHSLPEKRSALADGVFKERPNLPASRLSIDRARLAGAFRCIHGAKAGLDQRILPSIEVVTVYGDISRDTGMGSG
jgi:hypothetical protein